MKQIIINIILVFITVYLLISFITLNLDLSIWSIEVRLSYILVSSLLCIIVSVITDEDD